MFRLRTLAMLAAAIAAMFGLGVYRAAQSVPEFYHASLSMPSAVAEKAGDEFTATTVSLASQARREGEWSALFTDAQVNGWLATDLPAKHPELLSAEYEEPRVHFTEKGLQLGVRCKLKGVKTVVWVDVDVQMSGAHEAALRFRRVRAGMLPLPLGEVLDGLTQAAKDLELPLRWTTVDGDPTAVVGLPSVGGNGLRYELDAVQLADGKLYVSGRTSRLAAGEKTTLSR